MHHYHASYGVLERDSLIYFAIIDDFRRDLIWSPGFFNDTATTEIYTIPSCCNVYLIIVTKCFVNILRAPHV